jgi:hypothetical protein
VSGSVLPLEKSMCESVPWNVLTHSASEVGWGSGGDGDEEWLDINDWEMEGAREVSERQTSTEESAARRRKRHKKGIRQAGGR